MDKSRFLTEYQWGPPIYPIRCFTCQREVQTCGTRYYCMILKMMLEPGQAELSHEVGCLACWKSLYQVMEKEFQHCPAHLTTLSALQSHTRQVYKKFTENQVCKRKTRKRQNALRVCCRRMIFTNVDLTDTHNNYKQWIHQIPSIDEHSLTRRSIKLTDEDAHKAMVARGLGTIFYSKRELSIGQMKLSHGSVTDIDRCVPLPKFRCWNCCRVWLDKLCLGWVMKISRKRNRKTRKLYYLWTVRGEFCSPGCMYVFAWNHPSGWFPRQTAEFNKFMLEYAYKYKKAVVQALPLWKLPICTNWPIKSWQAVCDDPIAETNRLCDSWQVELKNPDKIKNKFVDESSTAVMLLDIKRFNMYMQKHMVNKATPLFWYDDFLKDFAQFSTVHQQIDEMKKHAPKPTFKPMESHPPSHRIVGDKKISPLLLKFLQHTEEINQGHMQKSVVTLFENDALASDPSLPPLTIVNDHVNTPTILSPSPVVNGVKNNTNSSAAPKSMNLLTKSKKHVSVQTSSATPKTLASSVSQFFQASSPNMSSSFDK